MKEGGDFLEGRRQGGIRSKAFLLMTGGCMAARRGLNRGEGNENSSSEVEGVKTQLECAPGLDDKSDVDNVGVKRLKAEGGQGNLERSVKANFKESGELCGVELEESGRGAGLGDKNVLSKSFRSLSRLILIVAMFACLRLAFTLRRGEEEREDLDSSSSIMMLRVWDVEGQRNRG